MQEDMTLLMILEARDMASAVVRGLRRNLNELSGAQKLQAAGFLAGGIASLDIAKKVTQFVASGTKQAIGFNSQMNLIATQAQASQRELKTMNDYLLANSAKWGVGAENLVRGLYNIESVGARAQRSLNGLHVTSKDLIKSTAQLQFVATAGQPGQLDSQIVAKALLQPFTTGIITQRVRGQAVHGFRSAAGAAGAINKVVGLGDMRMPDFLSSLASGFVANLQSEGFDWRSTMAAFDTLTDTGLPAQRAGVYLRQLGANVVSAANKPKTEGMLSTIGLTGEQLQADISKPGSMLTLMNDLRSHMMRSGELGLVRGMSIAKAFGVSPKTKADLTADLQFLSQHIDKMSKLAKEKLAGMLGSANRMGSMQTALAQLVDQVKAGRGNTDWAKRVMVQLFGGARTGSAGSILLDEPVRFRDRYAALANPGGRGDIASLHRSFKDTLKSPQGEIAQYHAAVQNLKLAIGEGLLPLLTKLFTGMNKILVPLTTWASKHKALAAAIAISIAVFFGLVAAILFASAAFMILSPAAAAFEVAIAPLILTIVAIAAAIGLLIFAGYELIKHWSTVKIFFRDFWTFLKDSFKAAFFAIEALFWAWVAAVLLPLRVLVDGFGKAFSWIPGLGGKLKVATGAFDRFYDGIVNRAKHAGLKAKQAAYEAIHAFDHHRPIELVSEHGAGQTSPHRAAAAAAAARPRQSLWNQMGGFNPVAGVQWFAREIVRMDQEGNRLIARFYGSIYHWFVRLWDDVARYTQLAWTDLSGWLLTQWNRLIALGEFAWANWRGWLGTLWMDIENQAATIWNDVVAFFSGIWVRIRNDVIDAWNNIVAWFAGLPGRILNALGDAGTWLYNLGKDALTGLWNGIVWVAENGPGYALEFAKWILGVIGSAASWLWGLGESAASGLWSGLKSALQTAVSWAGQVGQWVSDAIGSPLGWLADKGSNAASGLWGGIKSGLQATVSWASSVAGWVSSAIGDAGGWLWAKGSSAASGLWNGLKSGLNTTISWAGQVGGWISSALGDGTHWLAVLAAKIAAGFWGGLKHALQHPGKFLSGLASAIKDVLEAAWKDALGIVGKGVHWFLGKIGLSSSHSSSSSTPPLHNSIRQTQSAGVDVAAIQAAVATAQQSTAIALEALNASGLPTNVHALGVPMLANGGIVTGPTLAMIGEAGREAVIPLSQGGGLGGNTIIVDLSGAQFVDDASINRFIDKLGPALTRYVLPGAGIQLRR